MLCHGTATRNARRRNLKLSIQTATGFRAFCASLTVLAMLSVGSSVARGQKDSGRSENVLYAELAKAPAKAVSRRNPLEHDPESAAAGAKLYGLHCAECHGPAGEGGQGAKKGPSLRVDEVQQATPGTLFWLLTNGVVRRGMPVWSKLPEPERWQLVDFIKSLNERPKAAPGSGKP